MRFMLVVEQPKQGETYLHPGGFTITVGVFDPQIPAFIDFGDPDIGAIFFRPEPHELPKL